MQQLGALACRPEQARGSVVDTRTDISRKKPLAIAAAHSSGDGSSGLASGLMVGLVVFDLAPSSGRFSTDNYLIAGPSTADCRQLVGVSCQSAIGRRSRPYLRQAAF